MGVSKILKVAFILSVGMYTVVALMVAGPPDWSRPLLPERSGAAPLLGILAFVALSGWGAGMVVGRMAQAPQAFGPTQDHSPWPRTRFILAAALLESGAIAGLVLSMLGRDSRFAIAAAAVTAVLLLMTPAPEQAQGA